MAQAGHRPKLGLKLASLLLYIMPKVMPKLKPRSLCQLSEPTLGKIVLFGISSTYRNRLITYGLPLPTRSHGSSWPLDLRPGGGHF